MDKNRTPQKLAVDIAGRSSCSVQVGAVIVDRKGRLLSWGWNHSGSTGFGCCAETGAIMRANRRRIPGSTIFIAGFRAKNGNAVTSKPCNNCARLIRWSGIDRAVYLTNQQEWQVWNVERS